MIWTFYLFCSQWHREVTYCWNVNFFLVCCLVFLSIFRDCEFRLIHVRNCWISLIAWLLLYHKVSLFVFSMILVLSWLAPNILNQLLSFSYLRLPFFACMCILCAYMCVYFCICTCTYVWEARVDTGCLPQSLFSLSPLNPEFTDLGSVFKQFTPGVPCLHLSWIKVTRGLPLWDLIGSDSCDANTLPSEPAHMPHWHFSFFFYFTFPFGFSSKHVSYSLSLLLLFVCF